MGGSHRSSPPWVFRFVKTLHPRLARSLGSPFFFIKTPSPSLLICYPTCLSGSAFPGAKAGSPVTRWGKFRVIYHCQQGGGGVFITTLYMCSCTWSSFFYIGLNLDRWSALSSEELYLSDDVLELPSVYHHEQPCQSASPAPIPSNNALFKKIKSEVRMWPSFWFAGSYTRGFAGINKSLYLWVVGTLAFSQTFSDSAYQLFASTLGRNGSMPWCQFLLVNSPKADSQNPGSPWRSLRCCWRQVGIFSFAMCFLLSPIQIFSSYVVITAVPHR